MRIKGIAVLNIEQLALGEGDRLVIQASPEENQLLGNPDENDVLIGLSTDEPDMHEVVCLTDIPEECFDPGHLVHEHTHEIEVLMQRFKN